LAITHASQVPLHALVQQTPSAQNPPAHWALAVQVPPSARVGEQVLVVRSQNDPDAQFAVLVQAAGKQPVAFMQATPPGQGPVLAVPGVQAPAPLQLAGVTVSCEPAHDDLPVQARPEAANAQARFPSQNPVVPQVALLGAQSLSALFPLGSAVQRPSVPPLLLATQDSQIPAQSLLQQTWSALEQTPVAHWVVEEQAAPGESFGLQVWVVASHRKPVPHPASPLHPASERWVWSAPASTPLDVPPPFPPTAPPWPPAPVVPIPAVPPRSLPPSFVVFTKVADPHPSAVTTARTRISSNLRAALCGDGSIGRISFVMNLGDIYTPPSTMGYEGFPLASQV